MNNTSGEENESAGSPREALLQRLQAQSATGEPRDWDRDSLYEESSDQEALRELLIEGMNSPEGPLADAAYFGKLRASAQYLASSRMARMNSAISGPV
jgi:hypothetical protein